MMELFTKLINNLNRFSVNNNLLYLLKTRENLCFSGVFRAHKMRTSARNELKNLNRCGNVGDPHKHKSYKIFWKLFYPIS